MAFGIIAGNTNDVISAIEKVTSNIKNRIEFIRSIFDGLRQFLHDALEETKGGFKTNKIPDLRGV